MNSKLAIAVCAVLLLSGCAQSAKYNWGSYSQSLYEYYRDPTREAAYMASLQKIVNDPHAQKKIPPGILAEYGYVEMQHGNFDSAVALFEKEKRAWPESTHFMDAAIKLSHSNGKAPIDQATPTAKPVS